MEILSFTDLIKYIFTGAGVGFTIGLTGVGGGSLMTPLLLLFNFPTHIAIGTDLVYAAITKSSGVFAHSRQSTIDWKIVFRLASGSIPASIITVYILKNYLGDPEEYQDVLLTTLGAMLIVTSAVIIFKQKLLSAHLDKPQNYPGFLTRYRTAITVAVGVLLGICVTLSSVGAGAFGAAVLMVLYPRLDSVKIVGTDIAHAVPLTLIAGVGHMQLGNVDFLLLACLLVGSLPAIHFGTKLSKLLPNKILQPTLASILFVIGVKYVVF